MRIYELQVNFNYSLAELIKPDGLDIFYDIGLISIKNEWKCEYIRTVYDENTIDFEDFTKINSHNVFSKRAIDILNEMLIHGELLPLKYKDKDYFIYNIFIYKNFIDIEASEVSTESEKNDKTKVKCKHLIFKENEIDRHIFKDKTKKSRTFVTDSFVAKVQDNNLKGFLFIPQWDSELGFLLNDPKQQFILT